ncbi:MAG TPA: hypothetical protein VE130_09150 [Nitrososphaeraceae archaeon]|nr:hypothetical protein [Nitrososphaeraceae archaeon]
MSPEIYDWEATLHKLVTSSEGDLIGNVDAIDDTGVLVSTEGARTHYKIPKNLVEGFDGHAVSLKVDKQALDKFKTSQGEGFGEVK